MKKHEAILGVFFSLSDLHHVEVSEVSEVGGGVPPVIIQVMIMT
jgi:hypothetical protein